MPQSSAKLIQTNTMLRDNSALLIVFISIDCPRDRTLP